MGVGAAELAGATLLLAGLASSTLLLALVALVAAALGAAAGALLAEAQEAVGHTAHLLRSRDTSVTNGAERSSDNSIIPYSLQKCKHLIDSVRNPKWVQYKTPRISTFYRGYDLK